MMPVNAWRGVILVFVFLFWSASSFAAPYAALVMDARSGEVLHARNADTRLHPASLTKMMTLYVAFEAIRLGEISLDEKIKVSRKAASEPPSKLGLREGQKIKLRYLIRAAAVKSANDAATAIAEAVSGSEAAFARRMNRTARALGMTRTTFKNAHGLTEDGHMSTARDMTILGRRLFYDYPDYYNLFSRRTTTVGGTEVRNTNRKLLAAYKGADGIKTGYTRAAGFNLVASAERGGKRVIATVFGGRSSATRNQRVAELLDMGFGRAPNQVAEQRPNLPSYDGGRTTSLVTAVLKSPRPKARRRLTTIQIASAGTEIEAAVLLAQAEALEEEVMRQEQEIAMTKPIPRSDELEIVTRVSTSSGQHWAVYLGAFSSRSEAEKLLLRTALQDLRSLEGALRKVVPRSGKYQANFVGLSELDARKACVRLRARNAACTTVGPDA